MFYQIEIYLIERKYISSRKNIFIQKNYIFTTFCSISATTVDERNMKTYTSFFILLRYFRENGVINNI